MSAMGQPTTRDSGTGPTIGLVAGIMIVIAGLWSLDVFLARTERDSVRNDASGLHQEGERLLDEGHAREAVDLLRRAHAMQRENRQYLLDYVAALVAASRFEDADANLAELLQADPNNGPANLLAARLAAKEGKTAQANSHYHRAIYGVWPEKPVERRIAARLELADLLASRGEQQELLAELLPLESEAQGNPATLKKIAQLYLVAGSPARSVAVDQELIRLNSGLSDPYAALGQAELVQGDYRAALAAFQNASRHGSGDPAVDRGIELARTIAAIDPTSRRLSTAEKYARSMTILRLARDVAARCVSDRHPANVSELQQMVADCDKLLSKKQLTQVSNELAEARLALAEQLWQGRVKACGAATDTQEEPLRLILAKLARS